LIGQYIEAVFASGVISATDRDILHNICPSISSKVKSGTNMDDDQQEEEEMEEQEEDDIGFDDPPHKESDHEHFLTMLLHYLYSGNPVFTGNVLQQEKKKNTKSDAGKRVQRFIDRATELGLLQKSRSRGDIKVKPPYPPSTLLRSVAGELVREIKKHYRNGSVDLEKKVTYFCYKIHLLLKELLRGEPVSLICRFYNNSSKLKRQKD
jgi:hypothetical protein